MPNGIKSKSFEAESASSPRVMAAVTAPPAPMLFSPLGGTEFFQLAAIQFRRMAGAAWRRNLPNCRVGPQTVAAGSLEKPGAARAQGIQGPRAAADPI